jgi:hypothetical protein
MEVVSGGGVVEQANAPVVVNDRRDDVAVVVSEARGVWPAEASAYASVTWQVIASWGQCCEVLLHQCQT